MGYKNDDRCLDTADDDEPIFVLLGRDPMGTVVTLIWAALSQECQHGHQIMEAQKHAGRMSFYCEKRNPGRWDERMTAAGVDRAMAMLSAIRETVTR